MNNMPIITLSNGVRVGNFSSPHPFTFTDGSVLPACDAERARELMLNASEEEYPHPDLPGVVDIFLEFDVSGPVLRALDEAHTMDVNVILVPFPVQQALREAKMLGEYTKTRVIRVADRITKAIFIDKFCL